MNKRTRIILIAIAALVLPFAVQVSLSRAQAATPSPAPPCGANLWVVRTPVPYAARGIFAASDGTFVYAGGGYDGATVHADLLRFDPVANSWTSLASSPDQHFLSPAVHSPVTNKIYNFGGFGSGGSPTNTTRIYDIASNTWSTGAPMPAALTDQAAVYSNGVAYVAGGFNGSVPVNTLYAYDIAGNSWSTLAPMPQALYLPGFGAINGKVYIAAGNDGTAELNQLNIYDIASNSWSTGAPAPVPVTGPGSTVLNGQLFLYGGGFPTTRTLTQIYDLVTDSWSSGPNLNINRLWFYGTAVGDSIVAPGGDQVPGTPVNANEQLTCPAPATPTPTSTPTPTNTPVPPTPTIVAGNQGCGTGYWKQDQHFGSWCGGFIPTGPNATQVSSVFTIPACLSSCEPASLTLLQALSLQGGPGLCGAEEVLLRAAVAALLNSCSVSYPLTTAQVISEVNTALSSCNRTTILNEATRLSGFNSGVGGCPLH